MKRAGTEPEGLDLDAGRGGKSVCAFGPEESVLIGLPAGLVRGLTQAIIVAKLSSSTLSN